jgi:hypothetical protein
MPSASDSPVQTLDYAAAATGASTVSYHSDGSVLITLATLQAAPLWAGIILCMLITFAFAAIPWCVAIVLTRSTFVRVWPVATAFSLTSLEPLFLGIHSWWLLQHREQASVLQIS